MEKQKPEIGSLKVSEDVIASIASVAASEVRGVSCMEAAPASLKGLLGSKSTPKSVRVNMKNEVAQIDVYVRLELGARIQEVAEEIQKRVKEAVQNMTGMIVARVDVHIADVELPSKEEDTLKF